MTNESWYAVYTNSNAEKRVLRELTASGVEAWLPSIDEVHRWTDRKKKVERLVFPGYVFVRLADTSANRVRVLRVAGVVRILGLGGGIEPVPDFQIDSLRRLIDSHAPLGITPLLQAGTLVRVKRGPLAGLEGELVGIRNAARLVVSIQLLSQSVSAEIDSGDVEPLYPATRVAIA